MMVSLPVVMVASVIAFIAAFVGVTLLLERLGGYRGYASKREYLLQERYNRMNKDK